MIIETHVNNGLKAHVCMLRLNGEIHYTVDVFDLDAKMFLPTVKVYGPDEKELAAAYARKCVEVE